MTDERTFNNRYKIERRLGDGGMAVVYAGTDILLRRRVAIKVLREQFAADEDFVRRFYYEAQSAARLSHPNIVNTYDVGHEDGTYFIVMELVDGTTLGEMIRADGRIPEPVAIDYAAQICNGLAYAHRQGLLHRDIKPANILITHDDVVKLSDFGIARAVTQQTLTVTQPGMVMGSVYYLSPEQAQGLELRESSDLYSVGVVLYQMLSGQLPFSGESPVAVALKHVSEPALPLSRIAPETSPALAAIVERLLAKDPAERFQAATEVASALREARERPMVASAAARGVSGATAAMGPVGEGPMRPPPRRAHAAAANGFGAQIEEEALDPAPRHRLSIASWVGLIVVLLAAVAGGYALFGSPLLPFAHSVALADETGRSAIDAQRDLEGAGLHVKFTPVTSDTAPNDRIVRQNPPGGAQVPLGDEVELFVSTGIAPKEIDNVVGFSSADDAQKALERSGFKTKLVEQFSDKPKGMVLATLPKPGDKLKPGETVTLTVSKGSRPVVVPDLVGHTLADAQAALVRAKFVVNVQRSAVNGVPPDQVASQDPPAGTKADGGSTVTITVSNGAGFAAVPNLGGQALADAMNSLQSAGLVAKISYVIQPGGDGTVVQQDPPPAAQAALGSTVSISVAVSGNVPDVSGMTIDVAKAMLLRYGYQAGNVSYVPDGDEGKVVRTYPGANTSLPIGGSVALYVGGAR